MRTVLKFGGTSVASPAALQRVAEIVKGTPGERIVVVSATAGTTDALIGAARGAEKGDAQTAQDIKGIPEIEDYRQDEANRGELRALQDEGERQAQGCAHGRDLDLALLLLS